uniref:Uncharacterized protein n=1 Tax=Anguilla anguilla TaxID=7936 RepID=A0A0E9WTV3_ANGAN
MENSPYPARQRNGPAKIQYSRGGGLCLCTSKTCRFKVWILKIEVLVKVGLCVCVNTVLSTISLRTCP